METCLLWHKQKSVRLNTFKTKAQEFALKYTSFMKLHYHWGGLYCPILFLTNFLIILFTA